MSKIGKKLFPGISTEKLLKMYPEMAKKENKKTERYVVKVHVSDHNCEFPVRFPEYIEVETIDYENIRQILEIDSEVDGPDDYEVTVYDMDFEVYETISKSEVYQRLEKIHDPTYVISEEEKKFAFYKALELQRLREPRKPQKHSHGGTLSYVCPKCNMLLFRIDLWKAAKNVVMQAKYCLGCGQKLKWGNSNE